MIQTLYLFPVPSTALLHGERFQVLPGRICSLTFEYEKDDDEVISLKLIFEGVEAFKCTYCNACPIDIIKVAYDKVVDLGATNWFSEITESLSGNIIDLPKLYHLAIYFDDGPCYEFVCREFRTEEVYTSLDK